MRVRGGNVGPACHIVSHLSHTPPPVTRDFVTRGVRCEKYGGTEEGNTFATLAMQ